MPETFLYIETGGAWPASRRCSYQLPAGNLAGRGAAQLCDVSHMNGCCEQPGLSWVLHLQLKVAATCNSLDAGCLNAANHCSEVVSDALQLTCGPCRLA